MLRNWKIAKYHTLCARTSVDTFLWLMAFVNPWCPSPNIRVFYLSQSLVSRQACTNETSFVKFLLRHIQPCLLRFDTFLDWLLYWSVLPCTLQVYPVTQCPEPTMNRASADLIAKHRAQFSTERILLQVNLSTYLKVGWFILSYLLPAMIQGPPVNNN